MKNEIDLKNLVNYSLLLTIAVILGFIESFIPNPFPIPGVKIGLPNIITVFLLYEYNFISAFIISILRILIVGFLFGSLSTILYSFSGMLFSIVFMYLFKKLNFNIISTSILGGIMHNFGQLLTAAVVTNTYSLFSFYGPILFISGLLTGLFVGLIDIEFIKVYKRIKTR